MNKEKITTFNQIESGFRINPNNELSTRKVIINNIEITSLEDWEKVVGSITKLQQKNKQLQERIEYLERSNNRREDTILEQRQKIGDLEDNWNKLKEYLFDIRKRGFALQNLANVTKNTEPNIAILIIINKIQELEGSDSIG